MALSYLIIRQARAAGKTYNLPDSDGLGLVLSPATVQVKSSINIF